MKLRFDANQDYQLEAISAVTDLFKGQPGPEAGIAQFRQDAATSLQLTEVGIANRCVLTPEQWLDNLRVVQGANGLEACERLEPLVDSDGEQVGNFPNFTVEMETGTGKTYVYLRTIHELHKRHGFSKFVIVVPSVAIREGVLKSLQVTANHFRRLYDARRTEFAVYESARLHQLRNFALSDALQVLVINIDAFAKDADPNATRAKGNVINQLRETGIRPIEFIQQTHPIVILDEPQNLETDKRKRAIARLNPMCALRYSATHRETYNRVYSLDPVRAYELGLVKQISVDSVVDGSTENQAYVELESFSSTSRSISAKATIWVNQARGPKKRRVTLKNGSDLYKLSKQREIYRNGFVVNEIDAESGFVRFANDVTVRVGVPHGAAGEQVMRMQIEATIRRHFEKARKLEPLGIKVLSVFFIDRVSSYRVYHEDGSTTLGPFGQWFEEIYARYAELPEFAGIYELEPEQVHNGYFARDKQAVSPYSETSFKTKSGAEGGAFELIMRDKERLLDVDEPLRFIFSHSALREGWDNPNVFQICTLAETRSEMRKRQEIGRGLRLCVNQEGRRVMDRHINRLTVIANETYVDFANQLQTEMAADGVEFRADLVKNEREKVTVRLRKGYQADPNFLALWERIRQRTRYRVNYSTDDLIEQAAERIRTDLPGIERPQVVLTRTELDITRAGIDSRVTGIRPEYVTATFQMPDLIAEVQGRTGLSRATVGQILLDCGRLEEALNHPQAFIDQTAALIRTVLRELLVAGVEYQKVGDRVYEMRRFEDSDLMEVFASNVYPVNEPDKTLFSHIVLDGQSAPERRFAEDCENNDDVLFYFKLPRWFTIDTPVGQYNPDWALVLRGEDTLYFVAETKGTSEREDPGAELLRPIERMKVKCGKRHFKQFEEVRFRRVKELRELLG
ncbi:DEAD/DEAH box helicase family protein [Wenzhouxiangella sp. AB-CW3]|uniref:restriction endonuclease n=1 Tax=Wenzhouxiangella sp. AB-CW3 TaxID=2771012 RepID=UPI00168A44BC|nr:DEAD/DEAH box helicase family protein [Wenzhouxiangella sp. AB-CW3]QOC22344.1 DEAD/DEAH box helicase family protein [Wenzhouxiangella sp. AB-CW3]